MSHESLAIVRGAWDAWIAGDLDALIATFAPDVEWDTRGFEAWPEDEVYRGHDGVRRFFDEWLASWERYESGVDELRVIDEDRVLVLCWQRAFGRGGVPVDMDWAQVCTVRDGLIQRIDVYFPRAAALAAVAAPAGQATPPQ